MAAATKDKWADMDDEDDDLGPVGWVLEEIMAIKSKEEAEAAKKAVKEPVEDRKVEPETVLDIMIFFEQAERQAREEARMMEDVDALLELVVGDTLGIEEVPTKAAKLPG